MNIKFAFAVSIVVSLLTSSTRGADGGPDLESRITALEQRLQQINSRLETLAIATDLPGEKPRLPKALDDDVVANDKADELSILGDGEEDTLRDDSSDGQEVAAKKVAIDSDDALTDELLADDDELTDDEFGLALPGDDGTIDDPLDETAAADKQDDDTSTDDADDDLGGLLADLDEAAESEPALPTTLDSDATDKTLDQRVARIEQLVAAIEKRLALLGDLGGQAATSREADQTTPRRAARPTGPAENDTPTLATEMGFVVINNWTGVAQSITVNGNLHQLTPGRNEIEVEYGSVTTRMSNEALETLWELRHWRPVGGSQHLVLDLKN